jgi:hypothetical protein
VLLGTPGQGIVRAEKEAGAWSVVPLRQDLPVRCLAFGSDTVWVGTQGDGIWRSDDGGRKFRRAGLEGRVVKAVCPSPHDPDLVYAGLKPAGLAASRDGGARWSELEGFRKVRGRRFWFSPAEPPGSAYVQGLAVSPTDPDVLVAGIEFGAVVRSGDGGRSWSGHCRGAIRDCHSLVFHATDGDRIYEAGAGWRRRPFATSRDGGRTWSSPSGGNDQGYGWACAADPGDPDTVYCSAAAGPGRAHGTGPADARIYRSRGGEPWEPLAGGLPDPLDAMPYSLLTDPAAPGHLYAGLASGQVWFTADHGESWAPLDADLGSIHRVMLVLT